MGNVKISNAKLNLVVVLHNIRSVHNVGSIFRTADATGVKKIYLCGITPTPIDRFGRPRKDFTKVSLGAEKSVEWEKVSARKINGLFRDLKSRKYEILAVEQSPRSILYYKHSVYERSCINGVALVLGNEVKGLPQPVLKRADRILEIPMRGKKESLNVAVAFGIVAFGLLYN